LPVPDVVPRNVIHDAAVSAFQEQFMADTLMVETPPAAPMLSVDGDTVTRHVWPRVTSSPNSRVLVISPTFSVKLVVPVFVPSTR
jgi:hypothetical protein